MDARIAEKLDIFNHFSSWQCSSLHTHARKLSKQMLDIVHKQ